MSSATFTCVSSATVKRLLSPISRSARPFSPVRSESSALTRSPTDTLAQSLPRSRSTLPTTAATTASCAGTAGAATAAASGAPTLGTIIDASGTVGRGSGGRGQSR